MVSDSKKRFEVTNREYGVPLRCEGCSSVIRSLALS